MADPVKVQFKQGSNTAGTPAITFDNPVTAGSVVVVGVYLGSTGVTASAVADNKTGNVYAKVANSHDLPVDGDAVEMWWASINNGGSSFTVTVTVPVGARADLIEVGPCDPSPLSQSNVGYNAASSTPSSGNVTTNASVKEVAVGYYGTDTGDAPGGPGLTPGSGWTADFDQKFRGMIHKDAIATSSTIAANGTFPGNEEWAMLIATFKGVSTAITAAQEAGIWSAMNSGGVIGRMDA